jgi:hypothetical protein
VVPKKMDQAMSYESVMQMLEYLAISTTMEAL